jgi:hypothetical protein
LEEQCLENQVVLQVREIGVDRVVAEQVRRGKEIRSHNRDLTALVNEVRRWLTDFKKRIGMEGHGEMPLLERLAKLADQVVEELQIKIYRRELDHDADDA